MSHRWMPVLLLCLLFPGLGRGQEELDLVTLRGPVTVTIETDFAKRTTRTVYTIEEEGGDRGPYRIHFGDDPPSGLQTGSRATIRGNVRGDEIVVAGNTGGAVEETSAAAGAPTGDQRTIAMLLNCIDAPVAVTTTQVSGILFSNADSVDAFYAESSFNQTSFSGDVVGPYAVNFTLSATYGSTYSVAAAADSAATGAGVNLSAYTRRVYVLPGFGRGLANVGGNPSRAWIWGGNDPFIFAHELGHNLGMDHAATPDDEYGDASDVMGRPFRLVHPNAPHKIQMGWLPAARVLTLTTGGTHSVGLLEQAGGDVQALKIAKPYTNEHYYISYRRPVGFDANLAADYADRVCVHRFCGTGRPLLIGVLSDGGTFLDWTSGFSFTMTGHGATSAAISVDLSLPPVRTPLVTISPAEMRGMAGAAADYAVSVTNTDDASRPPTTFTLAADVPSGWTASHSPVTLSLAPGSTGTAIARITSAPTAADGSYPFTISVGDGVESLHATSCFGSYEVTDTIVPTCSITFPANNSTLSGVATVDVTAGDNRSVTSVSLYMDAGMSGPLYVDTDTSAPYSFSWNTALYANGSHTLRAYAYDAVGNVGYSPQIAVTVDNPAVASIVITPSLWPVSKGGSRPFVVEGFDAAGNPTPVSGAIWSATAGSIDPTGRYAAPQTAGLYTITCAVGSLVRTASARVPVSVLRGDANGDAIRDVLDVAYLVDYACRGGRPSAYWEEQDVNADGIVDILDVVTLVDYVFRGGSEPAPYSGPGTPLDEFGSPITTASEAPPPPKGATLD